MIYVMPPGNSASGYRQAGCQYIASILYATNRTVTVKVPGGSFNKKQDFRSSEFNQIADKIESRVRFAGNDDIALIHMLPDQIIDARTHYGAKANIGLTVTETDSIPTWLAKEINYNLTAVIVPTEWNKQVFQGSGVAIPIHVVPHTRSASWMSDIHTRSMRVKAMKDKDAPITFYYIGAWNYRKNPEGALRAYLKAVPTCQPSKFRFILKVSNTMSLRPYVKAIIENVCGSSDRLGKDVFLLTDLLSDEDVNALHVNSDCFISTHRGEGWGVSISDAFTAGNGIVYTDYSAPAEYIRGTIGTDNNVDALYGHYRGVDFTDDAVEVDGSAVYFCASNLDRIRWADPDSLDAETKIKDFITYYNRQTLGFTQLVNHQMIDRFSWDPVGKLFDSVLSQYE